MSTVADRLNASLEGRYRIERELGTGGMATVYLAADLRHDRKVAIKVLKPELAAVLGAERFVVEIKTTAALQHPHILPLFDSGSADGFLFYVMPYIQGETIREKLTRETQFGVDDAIRVVREIADALDYAHRHGVIHRDIKPENVLLHDGRPMVMDFGIALAVSAAAGGRMTETGLSLGTPHYMSPEQATAERELTPRSDIYSLASVLYEMLAGEPPHSGGAAQQVIMKIITERAQPVTLRRASVPRNVSAALSKALEKIPADRFETAAKFSAALVDPAFGVGVAGAPMGQTLSRTGARMPWVVAAVAVLAAASVVATARTPSAANEAPVPWHVELAAPPYLSGLAISVDGSSVAYGGPTGVWLRRAASVAPVLVAGTEGGCCPTFSPDGQQLAFSRGNQLHIVPIGGGESRVIGAGVAFDDDLAWTADGYVVGTQGPGGSSRGPLIRFQVNGGSAEPLTMVNVAAKEGAHWSPRALPDGRGVLFTILPTELSDTAQLHIGVVGPKGGAHRVLLPGRVATYANGHLIVTQHNGGVVAVPFDLKSLTLTGEPRPLFRVTSVPGTFTWRGYLASASTGTLVYVGGEDPRREYRWVERTGRATTATLGDESAFARVVISAADGTIAVQQNVDGIRPVVQLINPRTGARAVLEVPGGEVRDVSFTADGRSVVYRLAAPGRVGVYQSPRERLGERTLLLADEFAWYPTVSPNGRTLYVVRTKGARSDLLARSLTETSAEPYVLATSSTNEGWEPQFSPDGQWLAYLETGARGSQVYVRSTDPVRTERYPVAAAQGPAIRWAADGRNLYFIANDTMRSVTIAPGAEFRAGTPRAVVAWPYLKGFSVDRTGRFLTGVPKEGSASKLILLSDWRGLLSRP